MCVSKIAPDIAPLCSASASVHFTAGSLTSLYSVTSHTHALSGLTDTQVKQDAQQSFRQGKIVKIATPKTIADGAQTQALGHYTFALIQALVDDIVTVSDPQLVSTMKFFAERMKMLVEPTGCLAAAAALEGIVQTKGKRVGIIVSGGNIDLKQFAQLIST